jgi:hypothetical protein
MTLSCEIDALDICSIPLWIGAVDYAWFTHRDDLRTNPFSSRSAAASRYFVFRSQSEKRNPKEEKYRRENSLVSTAQFMPYACETNL